MLRGELRQLRGQVDVEVIPDPDQRGDQLPVRDDAVAGMRATAQWIIGTAAVVGTVLAGGAPLAGIGTIHGVKSAAMALAGLIVGLAGNVSAVRSMSDLIADSARDVATDQVAGGAPITQYVSGWGSGCRLVSLPLAARSTWEGGEAGLRLSADPMICDIDLDAS
jgi:hypothetical protein